MLLANATGFQPAAIALSQLTVPLLPLPSAPTPYYPPLSRSGSTVPQNPYPEGSPKPTSALAVLVDAFVRAAVVSETQDGGKTVVRGDPERKADLHFLASVFTNVTGVCTRRYATRLVSKAESMSRRRFPLGENSLLRLLQPYPWL